MSVALGVGAADGLTTAPVGAGRVLPVRGELADLLPWGGLRRGSTVSVRGSTSLLLALLATATAEGCWAAIVGLPHIGVLAAAELGVVVHRLALVPRPGTDAAAVERTVAALLDGVDLVSVAVPVAPHTARRLSARARQRKAVLLPFGAWPGADVELRMEPRQWTGLGAGHGLLAEREVAVHATGRGAAARPKRTTFLLPAAGGAIGPVRPAVRPVLVEPALSTADSGFAEPMDDARAAVNRSNGASGSGDGVGAVRQVSGDRAARSGRGSAVDGGFAEPAVRSVPGGVGVAVAREGRVSGGGVGAVQQVSSDLNGAARSDRVSAVAGGFAEPVSADASAAVDRLSVSGGGSAESVPRGARVAVARESRVSRDRDSATWSDGDMASVLAGGDGCVQPVPVEHSAAAHADWVNAVLSVSVDRVATAGPDVVLAVSRRGSRPVAVEAG